MYVTWKERLENHPHLKSFQTWPQIQINLLPKHKRKNFLRNTRIIAKVLKGTQLKEAAHEFGVSPSLVSQMLARCLAGEHSELPPLTKALIPSTRLNSGSRKKPLSTISNPCGARGSFTYLLEKIPNLKQQLNEVIIAGVNRDRSGQNLTADSFHKEFLRLLRDANWPETSYPFDQQYLAYESCRLYLNEQIAAIKMPTQKKTRTIFTSIITDKPYQEVQIDAQILDINTSVTLYFNGLNVPLRLSRVTLFLATDVATDCRLAYQLCLTKSPTQLDLLALLEKIHTPWVPLNLITPGLSYEPEACLPSELGELNQNASIGMIRLDNALCHMSHMVRDYVCNEIGATLNFGLPASPKSRNVVEYAFKLLNQYIHRFPSTTGSNPLDKLKETKKNSQKVPVISLNALNEILSVLITKHNVTPQERFGGLRPLDVMKTGMEQLFVPLCYSQVNKRANPFRRQKKVKVNWLKHENRRPHINFEGLRYSGDGLSDSRVIGTEIVIEYDHRDIRVLKAFSLEADDLGNLYAPKSWQNYPHSISTRRKVRKETRRSRISGIDPLAGYFSFLLSNKELPAHATELLRVYKEYTETSIGLCSPHLPRIDSSSNLDESPRANKVSNKIPAWSSMLEKTVKNYD